MNLPRITVAVNLIVLAYLNLLVDDFLKLIIIRSLTAINAYALGAILFQIIVKPIAYGTKDDLSSDRNG